MGKKANFAAVMHRSSRNPFQKCCIPDLLGNGLCDCLYTMKCVSLAVEDLKF